MVGTFATPPSREAKQWLAHAATLLILGAALLYLLGDAFRLGFLAHFGVDGDLFQFPVEKVLTYGFQALFVIAVNSWQLMTIVSLVLTAGWFLSRVRHIEGSEWATKLAAKLFYRTPRDADQNRRRHPVVHFALDTLGFLATIAAVVSILLVTWFGAWWSGMQEGEDLHTRLDQGPVFSGLLGTWPGASVTVLGQYGSAETLDGTILESSPDYVALYLAKQVVLIPGARIIKIKIPPLPAQG